MNHVILNVDSVKVYVIQKWNRNECRCECQELKENYQKKFKA